MQNSWELKQSDDLNRVLKLKNIEPNIEYNSLLVITHRYNSSDDVLFPEPVTLGFFIEFESIVLSAIEDIGLGVYVVSDIYMGEMKFYLYVKDYDRVIKKVIEYIKNYPQYNISFDVTSDKNWTKYLELLQP
jgi:hypothetical protein